jgi:hypothetical protein
MEKRRSEKKIKYNEQQRSWTKIHAFLLLLLLSLSLLWLFVPMQFPTLLDNPLFRAIALPLARYCSICLNHISDHDVTVTVRDRVTWGENKGSTKLKKCSRWMAQNWEINLRTFLTKLVTYMCVCWNNNKALLRKKENIFNTLEHYGSYMYFVLMGSLWFLQ